MNTASAYTRETTADTVAANLRAELSRQRWSGRKAAAALGLNPLYVARRISGEVELSVSDVVAFADLLEIPVSVLFADAKKAPTPKGGGRSLPDLDSNQEPAGNTPIALPSRSTDTPEHDYLAPITQIA